MGRIPPGHPRLRHDGIIARTRKLCPFIASRWKNILTVILRRASKKKRDRLSMHLTRALLYLLVATDE